MQMIKYISAKQLTVEEFDTTFGQKLNPSNKWVILANAIPWDAFVSVYSRKMSRRMGRTSIPPRLAVYAMIIKHLENLDDRGVVQALEENIYMHYFAGYTSFNTKRPFDPSLLVEMRHRMGKEAFDEMSLLIIQKAVPILEQMKAENKNVKFKNGPKNNSGNKDKNTINAESKDADNSEKNDDAPVGNNEINTEKTSPEIIPENTVEYSSSTAAQGENIPNQGTLIVDATVADQMIKFPTDIGLLNTARLQSERLIGRKPNCRLSSLRSPHLLADNRPQFFTFTTFEDSSDIQYCSDSIRPSLAN